MHVKERCSGKLCVGKLLSQSRNRNVYHADFPEADSDVGFKPGIIIKPWEA